MLPLNIGKSMVSYPLRKVLQAPATAVVYSSALKTGPKPICGELEIMVAEWLEQQAALKNRVSRISVIKKTLELRPDMYGRTTDPNFTVEARKWYYRWKDRRGSSISLITSKGQKKMTRAKFAAKIGY
jgi:hypothetical protein